MFGLVLLFQGLVQNWGGLMATRFFLGVFETGMFPGCKCKYQAITPETGVNYDRQVSICWACGTHALRLKSVSASSLAPLPWPALSVVSLPAESRRWTACAATVAGAGCSLSRAF